MLVWNELAQVLREMCSCILLDADRTVCAADGLVQFPVAC